MSSINDQNFEVTITLSVFVMGERKTENEIIGALAKALDVLPDDIDFGDVEISCEEVD